MEKIKDFYLELAKDDHFKAKLREFIQKNGSDYENIIENLILPQAKKMGYNFTKEDLIAYEKENKSNVLTDDDLLNVAGGFGISPKITAITRAFSRYPELWNNSSEKIEYITIPKEVRKDESVGQQKDNFSNVSCNPMTLHETISGAKNRAKNAFEYAEERCRHM